MAFSANHAASTRLVTVFALGALCWSFAAAPLHAQAVPGSPPNPKLKSRGSGVVTDLREKNFAALDESQFSEFFTDYYLQLFATPDPVGEAAKNRDRSIKPLDELRAELKTRYLGAGKTGAPYNRLNELTFSFMKALIAGDFPTSVKYHAMRVIGDLNDTEFDAAVSAKLRPHAGALDFMIKIVQSKNNARIPDYLKVAALTGITRHCENHVNVPMSPERRKVLTQTLVELLNQQSPPDTRTPEAQAWLRRMAATALGAMGEPGGEAGNEVLSTLTAAMKDAANPLSVRCAAAQAFDQMRFPPGVDTFPLCIEAASLVVQAAKKEKARAEENGDDAIERRRLAACNYSIFVAINGADQKHGLTPSAADEKKTTLTQIKTAQVALNKLLANSVVTVTQLFQKGGAIDTLEEIVKANTKAPAAPKAGAPGSRPAAPAGSRTAPPSPEVARPGGTTGAPPAAGAAVPPDASGSTKRPAVSPRLSPPVAATE